MARITTSQEDDEKPTIDSNNVQSFFDQRAKRLSKLGPLVTVIYQDKHPDIAKLRDKVDKQKILPLLNLDGSQRLLDIGCGTGRWTEILSSNCKWYHGIDFSHGLIEYAKNQFSHLSNCRFTQASASDFSLQSLLETEPFDVILCAGVIMYLNDDEVNEALKNFYDVLAESSRIIIREPMGIHKRLTLRQHYSEELEQTYNAIYRTKEELEQMMEEPLFSKGFQIVDSGNMYEDKSLNNRSETRQKWMLIQRSQR